MFAGAHHGQGWSTPSPSLPYGGDGDCVGGDDNVTESPGLFPQFISVILSIILPKSQHSL